MTSTALIKMNPMHCHDAEFSRIFPRSGFDIDFTGVPTKGRKSLGESQVLVLFTGCLTHRRSAVRMKPREGKRTEVHCSSAGLGLGARN